LTLLFFTSLYFWCFFFLTGTFFFLWMIMMLWCSLFLNLQLSVLRLKLIFLECHQLKLFMFFLLFFLCFCRVTTELLYLSLLYVTRYCKCLSYRNELFFLLLCFIHKLVRLLTTVKIHSKNCCWKYAAWFSKYHKCIISLFFSSNF
jgi:hypothetical protein